MYAFTLIALMLSMFGAIYTGLAAFRNITEADILARWNQKDLHVEDLKRAHEKAVAATADNVGAVKSALTEAERIGGKMKFWRRVCYFVQVAPTFIFLGFVFFMVNWALVKWSHIDEKDNWVGWKHMICYAQTLVILIIAMALSSWFRFRSLSESLKRHIATVDSFINKVRKD